MATCCKARVGAAWIGAAALAVGCASQKDASPPPPSAPAPNAKFETVKDPPIRTVTLPGSKTLGDQGVKVVEIGAQLVHAAPTVFDIGGIGATTLQIVQQRIEPVDLREDHAGYALVFGRRGDGEERGGCGDDSLGLARELNGCNRRRHAKLNDALQSFSDLQEGVHRGGCGDHGEGADPEER